MPGAIRTSKRGGSRFYVDPETAVKHPGVTSIVGMLPKPFLVHWAAGRPFAWLDDEITDADRAWTEAHHPARTLLHSVDHRHGLTDADFATLDAWLRAG